jgi:hypothetical protein
MAASKINDSVVSGTEPSSTGFTASGAFKIVCKAGAVRLEEKIDGAWYAVSSVMPYQNQVENISLAVRVRKNNVLYVTPADTSAEFRLVPDGGNASAEAWLV